MLLRLQLVMESKLLHGWAVMEYTVPYQPAALARRWWPLHLLTDAVGWLQCKPGHSVIDELTGDA